MFHAKSHNPHLFQVGEQNFKLMAAHQSKSSQNNVAYCLHDLYYKGPLKCLFLCGNWKYSYPKDSNAHIKKYHKLWIGEEKNNACIMTLKQLRIL